MQSFRFVVLTLISVLTLVQNGLGQINVQYLDTSSQWQVVPGFETPPAAGSNILITDTAGLTYRIFTVTPASQSIGNVTLTSSGTLTPTLLIGTGFSTPNDEQPLTSSALHIGSISYSGGRPRLQVSVGANISGDVSFWHIVRLDAGTGIYGNVTHSPVGASAPIPRLGVINAGEIGENFNSTTVVQATSGDINQVTATYAIYSTISCDNGSISLVRAGTTPGVSLSEGIIGCPKITAYKGSIDTVIANSVMGRVAPGYREPVAISARDGITLVQANYNMTADITANYGGGSGDLTRLESYVGSYPGGPAGTGAFAGTIAARNCVGNPSVPGSTAIYIDGMIDGNINLTGSLTDDIYIFGEMSATNTISIGGSVLSGTDITIGGAGSSSPTAGQIIINANNDNSYWSTTSTANLTGVSLSGIPWYTNLPSTFGGGAVGEAPFNYHAANCTPAHNSATAQGSFPTAAVVRHYGPVFTIGSAPVQVFARPTGTFSWTEYTSDFNYAVSTNNNRRDVSITKKTTGLGWAAGIRLPRDTGA